MRACCSEMLMERERERERKREREIAKKMDGSSVAKLSFYSKSTFTDDG